MGWEQERSVSSLVGWILPILALCGPALAQGPVWIVPVEGDILLQGWGDAALVFH